MWHGGRNGFQMRLLSDYYILTSTVYTCVLISTITVLRIQVVTLKPAHIWSCASTVIRVHLMSTPLCTLHQIWLIDLRRFQCYDPKPAVYAMLVLVRAKWLSSSTRPADARTKPAKKKTKKLDARLFRSLQTHDVSIPTGSSAKCSSMASSSR